MKKYQSELAVGIFVFIGLLCVSYITVKLGKMELFTHDGYVLYANFTTVNGLKAGASVEIGGVQIGKVSAITLDKTNFEAIVELRITDNVRLTDDVIASIKTSGLIGDKFINLFPGGSSTVLEDGDEITETLAPTDIEELISKYVFGDVKK